MKMDNANSTTPVNSTNQAIAANKDISTWFERATQHHQLHQYDDAELLYNRILNKDARHADSLHLLGLIEIEKGNLDHALDLLNKAIANNLNFAPYYFNRALLHKKRGSVSLFFDDVRRAILQQPDFMDAWLQLGDELVSHFHYEKAIPAYRQAQTINVQDKRAWHQLGNAFLALNNNAQAVECYDHVLKQHPDTLESVINKGLALSAMGQHDQAVQHYQAALNTHPNNDQLLNNLGLAYLGQRDFLKAQQIYEALIVENNNNSRYWVNLGLVYKEQGEHEIALNNFEAALKIEPHNAEAAFNIAITQLLLGQWEKGWQHYEARLALESFRRLEAHLPAASAPRWQGKEDLEGKTLLIVAEQGLGDTLQFIRYLPTLAKRGVTIILECQQELISLLEQQPQLQIHTIIPRGAQRPHYDYYTPILSLPLLCKTFSEQAIPFHEESYLCAPQQSSIKNIRQLFAKSMNKKKVGLVWAGGVHHKNNAARSIALSQFNGLSDLDNVDLYSLQYGSASQEINNSALKNMTDLSAHIHHFADTAALINELDLVVTVDTSVAHLSAALGKPTWVLIPYVPDFRWLLGRSDSPWYPSIRLIRQSKRHDWSDSMTQIEQILAEEKFV